MRKVCTLLLSLLAVLSLNAQNYLISSDDVLAVNERKETDDRRRSIRHGNESDYRRQYREDRHVQRDLDRYDRKELRVEKHMRPVAIVSGYGYDQNTDIDDYEINAIVFGGRRLDRTLERDIKRHFLETHVTGFQQSALPQFVLSSDNARFMLGISGYVNFRAAYDFMGMVDNIDFVTYDIPVPSGDLTRQKLYMGSTTSRLTFKAIANTSAVGRIVSVIETDFRGTPIGNLHLRLAYISFLGFTFGQNVTTFCDLNASPTTIDFEGPNSYNFNFNTMIRYEHKFGEHWSAALALEMPALSSSILQDGSSQVFNSVSQRIPDIPVYVQYNWGKNTNSHLRASFVFRDLMYYDLESEKTKGNIGWGVQLSGNIQPIKQLNFFMQGVYGKGITPYLQDITGSGLDLVEDPTDPNKLQTLPMYGGLAAVQYNVKPGWFFSGGYSQVDVKSHHGYKPDNQYHRAQYIFANTFYNLTPSLQIAVEYLHGIRKNMDGDKAHANRLQAMVQYNF